MPTLKKPTPFIPVEGNRELQKLIKRMGFINPEDYRKLYFKKIIELKKLEDEVVKYLLGNMSSKTLLKLTLKKYPKDRFTHISK